MLSWFMFDLQIKMFCTFLQLCFLSRLCDAAI